MLSLPQTCRRLSPSGTPPHLPPRPPQTKSAGSGPNTRIRRLRPLPPASSRSHLQHRKPCHSLLTPLHSLLAFWAVGPSALPCAGGLPPQRPPSQCRLSAAAPASSLCRQSLTHPVPPSRPPRPPQDRASCLPKPPHAQSSPSLQTPPVGAGLVPALAPPHASSSPSYGV